MIDIEQIGMLLQRDEYGQPAQYEYLGIVGRTVKEIADRLTIFARGLSAFALLMGLALTAMAVAGRQPALGFFILLVFVTVVVLGEITVRTYGFDSILKNARRLHREPTEKATQSMQVWRWMASIERDQKPPRNLHLWERVLFTFIGVTFCIAVANGVLSFLLFWWGVPSTTATRIAIDASLILGIVETYPIWWVIGWMDQHIPAETRRYWVTPDPASAFRLWAPRV